jgi:hypothetical protein
MMIFEGVVTSLRIYTLLYFMIGLGREGRASISKGRRRANFLLHTYQLQIQPFLSLPSISFSHLRIKIWNSTFKRGWRADVELRWMDGNGCVQKSRGRGGRD